MLKATRCGDQCGAFLKAMERGQLQAGRWVYGEGHPFSGNSECKRAWGWSGTFFLVTLQSRRLIPAQGTQNHRTGSDRLSPSDFKVIFQAFHYETVEKTSTLVKQDSEGWRHSFCTHLLIMRKAAASVTQM